MDTVAYEGLTGHKLASVRDNWKSLCPVHSESTPSFFIHKETHLCHCFGCGVKGYVDKVLAQAYDLKAETLRQQLDIPIHSLRMGVGAVLEPPDIAPQFIKAYLQSFEKISMHPFLKKRGFKSEVVVLHGTRWDPSGRIVFPLSSVGNPTTVGAVGRSVKKDDYPKWYFYWNTKKGNILYQALDTLELNIIVEGIFDVMWLNQHGYIGAAALIGAQATKHQIDIIKRNTDEVVLFLDNDEAGRIGSKYLSDALRSSVKVTFAQYPEGKNDPQELTKEELDTAIRNRLTYVEQYSGNNRR